MTKALLDRYMREAGVRPRRSAGQHFLLDETVVERMVEVADIKKGDSVLEVGPGFGVLTEKLLERGAEVVAIELDRSLAAWLEKKFTGQNIKIIQEDALRARRDQLFFGKPYKFVANIPYNITSVLFRQLLTQHPQPQSITALIQKEVAERMVAGVGEMSLLALSIQWFSTPSIAFTVEKEAFYPAPEVTSAVIHCANVNTGREEGGEEMMFRLARMGFAGKRKQLRNSLEAGLHIPKDQVDTVLLQSGIAPEARPQDLSIEKWLTLAKNIASERG